MRGDLTTAATDDRGFTLIEITLVVGLMCVVAAIAVPLLMRARMAGQESSALGSMRAVASAQSTYASSCSGGYFAPTLTRLTTAPAGGGDGFLGPDFAADPAVKSGYRFTLTPGQMASASPASCNGEAAGASVVTYFLNGDPVGTSEGRRFFASNSNGTVFESDTGAAVVITQTGTPPGASPVQ